MKRNIFVYILLAATAAVLGAQQASQQDPYAGTSNPPPDDTITTPEPQPAPVAKPSPSHPLRATCRAATDTTVWPAGAALARWVALHAYPQTAADGTDDGIVQVAPDASAPPGAEFPRGAIDSVRSQQRSRRRHCSPGSASARHARRGRCHSRPSDGSPFDGDEPERRCVPYARSL